MSYIATTQLFRPRLLGAHPYSTCRQHSKCFTFNGRGIQGLHAKRVTVRHIRNVKLFKLTAAPWQAHATMTSSSGPGLPGEGPVRHQLLHWVNDSVKWVVTAAAAFVLLRYRNNHVNWCLVGSIAAALSCKLLKKLINKQRPAHARKTDPGMPSSHATSLSYLATYLMIVSRNPTKSLLILGSSVFLTSLRVILGYHSLAQVCAGAFLGTGAAFAWHQLGERYAFQLINASKYGSAVLAVVTGTAGLLFLAKTLASAVHNSSPAPQHNQLDSHSKG